MNVLLVDDDPVFHFVHKKLLRFQSSIIKDVREAIDARTALDYLQSLSNDTLPDVILVDLNMPVMNGFQFIEAYHKLRLSDKKRIFLCVLSSSRNSEDFERTKELGVHHYLPKPLDVDRLNSLIIEFFQ